MAVADLEEVSAPPLFLDQTEGKKNFLKTTPPISNPDLILCLFTHPFDLSSKIHTCLYAWPAEAEEWGKAVRREKQKERQIRLNESLSLSLRKFYDEKYKKEECAFFLNKPSLRSKRFRLVSGQRNTEEGDFRF